MEYDLKKAVKWWSDQVRGNKPHDNGDDSPAGRMGMLMADSMRKPVGDVQIGIFEKALEEGLKALLDEWGGNNVYVGVDYSPGVVLSEAAQAAGIGPYNFPFKPMMLFKNGEIWVKEGYGAEPVQI